MLYVNHNAGYKYSAMWRVLFLFTVQSKPRILIQEYQGHNFLVITDHKVGEKYNMRLILIDDID